MLARNQNLAAPAVSFWSGYTPRSVTPAAPLLTGMYSPITVGNAPQRPQYFGSPMIPAASQPQAPAPSYRAPVLTPAQVALTRSPAYSGLQAYADYLRRLRGY